VTSVDYSAPCVEHMRHRNASSRPELRFEVADARALSLAPAAYDVIIEKGLLDAMLCTPKAAEGVSAMMRAVAAGLAPGGAFVLISFGAPRDRLQWVQHAERGWSVDVWTLPKPGAVAAAAAAAEARRESAGGEGSGGGAAAGGAVDAAPAAAGGSCSSDLAAQDADADAGVLRAARYVQGSEREGGAHYVYLFRSAAAGGEPTADAAPAAAASDAPGLPADAPPPPLVPTSAEDGARRWAF
jgi:hypothetical protein